MDFLKSYITPQNIGDYQLKKMVIPDTGQRYIYTSNRRYIRPFSVNTTKVSSDEFNNLVELYNREVLYEIEGDTNYSNSKTAEFAFLFEQMKFQFGDYLELNTLQIYTAESQLMVYFRKSTFMAACFNKDFNEIQLICIAPELDFQIDYILSFISKMDLTEISRNYMDKYKQFELRDISKSIFIYCLNTFTSIDIIREKFIAQGWNIDWRNQDYFERLL